MDMLPVELVFDILTRLPGKQVARCKCVCKLWRSMIGSRQFLEAYRIRQRGLLMLIYWPADPDTRNLRFFHSPLRRHDQPPADINPLCKLEISVPETIIDNCHGLTRVVDGLLCVGALAESSLRLSLYNVCTGEMMRLQDPLPYANTYSTYHLGYDQASGVYKLMRLIFNNGPGFLTEAHIMTLRPPSSAMSIWREMDHSAAGINVVDVHDIRYGQSLSEVTTCANQGMQCWSYSYTSLCKFGCSNHRSLLCFDFSKERFRLVEPPHGYHHAKSVIFHAVARFKDSLVVWLSFADDKNVISCYVMEDDDEGKSWSMQSFEIPDDFKMSLGMFLVLPSGKLTASSSSSHGNMLVMDNYIPARKNQPLRVYSYSGRHTPHDAYNEDLFFAGKLPERDTCLQFPNKSHDWTFLKSYMSNFGQVSCLLDGNYLYLSLDDILGGASPTL